MESLIVILILIVVAGVDAWRVDKKAEKVTCAAEAEASLETLRTVAKRRAARHSIPLHSVAGWENTGVTEVPAEMDKVKAEMKRADTEPNGTRRRRITRQQSHS